MLTYTTHRVLGALHAGIVKSGIAPSQREMATATGLQLSRVNICMVVLEQRGFIERERGKSRAVRVLRLPPDMGGVCPTCGK